MENLDFNDKLKKECIIAFKVYDQCRQQDCLTPKLLGPARSGVVGVVTTLPAPGETVSTGINAPINPPSTAAAVVIVPNTFSLTSIIPISKQPDPFRTGYYNIDLKFVFSYNIQFRDSNGGIIQLSTTDPNSMVARSIYNKTVSLFGSTGQNVSVFTDFVTGGAIPDLANGGPNPHVHPFTNNLMVAPFELVEANAMPLKATLGYVTPVASPGNPPVDGPPTPNRVDVTIGLFTIIKLFRLVNLNVESKGFCKPQPCANISADPCDYFSNLDFPFDAFDPPQKKDFFKHLDDSLDADDSDTVL
jgi:hypothetical protein